MSNDFSCHYDDCVEEFETSDARLRHSLEDHWDINPKKYPNITGAEGNILFDV